MKNTLFAFTCCFAIAGVYFAGLMYVNVAGVYFANVDLTLVYIVLLTRVCAFNIRCNILTQLKPLVIFFDKRVDTLTPILANQ